jgi:prepilin-type N-terminal cleavage/methylation domain-containing protein
MPIERNKFPGHEFAALRRAAFTLIELMTVITIIVLVLAAAVPTINLLEGNRSVANGYNRVAAALGHARQIALYYRAPAGVVFYQDPVTGRQAIAYVTQEKNIPRDAGFVPKADDREMDIIPGEEILLLPYGVAVQILNCQNGQSTIDAYLRIGIVLFDENGQLTSTPYWIRDFGYLGVILGGPSNTTPNPLISNANLIQWQTSPAYGGLTPGPPNNLYSHLALCIYDESAYLSQVNPATGGEKFSDADNNCTQTYSLYFAQKPVGTYAVSEKNLLSDKQAEQQWLSQNGQIYAIKPNDGSLLKNQ